jgi:superoxide dismutase, Cu-Zn family
MKKSLLALALGCAVSLPLLAVAEKSKSMEDWEGTIAMLKNNKGENTGHVIFSEGPNGLLADIVVEKLTPGWHAIHVHETGTCNKADFTDSGPHAANEHAEHCHAHGFLVEGGMHKGDMPNIWAHEDGRARAQAFLHNVTLRGEKNALLDEDGAAVIVHAQADDYKSQPSGNAGDRVACGVIAEKKAGE